MLSAPHEYHPVTGSFAVTPRSRSRACPATGTPSRRTSQILLASVSSRGSSSGSPPVISRSAAGNGPDTPGQLLVCLAAASDDVPLEGLPGNRNAEPKDQPDARRVGQQ